jgi:hypothetical protein
MFVFLKEVVELSLNLIYARTQSIRLYTLPLLFSANFDPATHPVYPDCLVGGKTAVNGSMRKMLSAE